MGGVIHAMVFLSKLREVLMASRLLRRGGNRQERDDGKRGTPKKLPQRLHFFLAISPPF
jgi:hypothetical protein